ncbi:hypothetical protein [Azohydromonas australica]|nr:hypothetical protein [Azohydromonas australica]
MDRRLRQRIAGVATRIGALTERKLYGSGVLIENHLFSVTMP